MSKFIIIQIKEERCAEPDISVGYNISKSDVDIKCSYDDINHKELNVSELKKLKKRIINGKNDNFESTEFGLCDAVLQLIWNKYA